MTHPLFLRIPQYFFRPLFSIQGHAVNLASRVEGATKHLGVPVLMTGSTHERLCGELPARKLCRVRVAGIDGAADIYELHTGPADTAWESLRDAYETALFHYEQGRFAEACRTLYPLISGSEGQYDLPSLTLVGRCIECLKSPHKSFDPVVELVQK